ncbi:hypothetical protein T4A_7803 [Trichinella pseudospiralis]|uniref:Uncharacterized protein n=1 Tax=Trichinella pseudospiralis TaxID=6337 RepID=A0A0V1EIJ4_TRIPS|nr:hypothetical protein T4A_7803 [Trichinella pseudospiralis]
MAPAWVRICRGPFSCRVYCTGIVEPSQPLIYSELAFTQTVGAITRGSALGQSSCPLCIPHAVAGRSVRTSVPHSDSPVGDELRKRPTSESGVVSGLSFLDAVVCTVYC